MFPGKLVWLVTLVSVLGSTACTTTRAIDTMDAAAVMAAIKPGEKAHVIEWDGDTYDMTIDEVTGSAVIGRRETLEQVEIPLDDIRAIEVKRIDQGRSLAAVAVGVLGIVIVGAAAAEAAGPAIVLDST